MPSSKMPTSEIPSGDQALALERLSRHQGSGITAEQLLGRWRLQLLWSKGRAQPNPATAALLRGLQASLSIATIFLFLMVEQSLAIPLKLRQIILLRI